MVEELSSYAHESWSRWVKSLFGKSVLNPDGSVTITIPISVVERWKRQIETEYINLPEGEKVSDRREANLMIDIMIKNIR